AADRLQMRTVEVAVAGHRLAVATIVEKAMPIAPHKGHIELNRLPESFIERRLQAVARAEQDGKLAIGPFRQGAIERREILDRMSDKMAESEHGKLLFTFRVR